MSISCPPIPRPLLEYLQKVFPDKLPQYLGPPESMALLIGNQQVLKHLEAQFQLQSKTVLPPTY